MVSPAEGAQLADFVGVGPLAVLVSPGSSALQMTPSWLPFGLLSSSPCHHAMRPNVGKYHWGPVLQEFK